MIKDLGNHKYRFIVSVGGRSDRKRYCKTITHNGGKRELKKLYEEYVAECKDAPATDVTVGELMDAYIAYCRTLGRKQTTIHGYEVAVKRFSSSVQAISAKDCTTYRLEKEVALMANNRLSAKSIKNSITLLSASYRHAIRIGQLKDNPCERLTLPKGQPREIRILHKDEIADFVFAIQDEPLDDKVAYELALFMGLRRSEILGLKEADVDIVRGIIDIHSTRHRVDGENVEQDTKTKRSTRVLAMPDVVLIDVAKLLQAHRDFPYEKDDFLIQDGFGNAIQPQALASRLARMEKRKELPKVSLHGLRHTYASMLHSQGIDLAAVSANLGHSNVTTTANIYTHIFKSPTQASRGIANTIDKMALGGKSVAKLDEEKTSEC